MQTLHTCIIFLEVYKINEETGFTFTFTKDISVLVPVIFTSQKKAAEDFYNKLTVKKSWSAFILRCYFRGSTHQIYESDTTKPPPGK